MCGTAGGQSQRGRQTFTPSINAGLITAPLPPPSHAACNAGGQYRSLALELHVEHLEAGEDELQVHREHHHVAEEEKSYISSVKQPQ